MNIWVILLIVAMIGGIVYLTHLLTHNKGGRDRALQELAEFLEGKVEPLEGFPNSFKIEFTHNGKPFVYEDIEDMFGSQPHYHGFLKYKTSTNLVLSFTEKSRTQMRSNIQSLQDVVTNPWGSTNVNDLASPPDLKEFTIFTNKMSQANTLLAHAGVVKVFARYKNVDVRGHPVMSLEIVEGVLLLRFHSSSELKPNLFDLRNNAASIEPHLENMRMVIDRLENFWNPT